jgi:nitrite reductase (NADH) small subunit
MIKPISEDRIRIETPDLTVIAQSDCPHRKGKLRFGRVNERRGTITCPLHYSTFDLRTGEQVSGPPCGSLEVSVVQDC